MGDDVSTSTVVRRAAAPPPRPWGKDLALILPTLGLIFAAVFNFGAADPAAALFWAVLQCAWAAVLCLQIAAAPPRMRLPLPHILAGLLFVALLAWSLVTILPLGGLGSLTPGPAWRLVDAPGALSIDPAATAIETFKLAGLGALFCAGWLIATDERRADRAIALLVWLGAAYAIWALAAFGATPRSVLGMDKTYHFDRLTGSFLSANSAGSLFGVLALTAWIWAMRGVRQYLQSDRAGGFRFTRPVNAALLRMALAGLFWVALLFTVSRTAVLATGACMIVVTAVEIIEELTRRRAGAGKIIGYTVPLVLAMMVVFAATVGPRLLERIPALGGDSDGRHAIFEVQAAAAKAAPIQGYGLGSFRTVEAGLIEPSNFLQLWNLGAAHNIYLQWRLEGGLIGFSLIAAAIAVLLVDISGRRIGGRAGRTRAAIALAASAILLIHNTVDYSLQAPAIAALWALLLGLGATPVISQGGSPVRRKTRQEHRSQPASG